MTVLHAWEEKGTKYRVGRFEGYLRIEEEIDGQWRGMQQDRVVAIRALEAVLVAKITIEQELVQLRGKHARDLAQALRGSQR